MQTNKQPTTTHDTAAQLVLERGTAMEDRLLRTMTKRVACALTDKREKRLAVSDDEPVTHQLWTVGR